MRLPFVIVPRLIAERDERVMRDLCRQNRLLREKIEKLHEKIKQIQGSVGIHNR